MKPPLQEMEDREDDLDSLLNKGAQWAVTYGDLMSFMMIFFLIMFISVISKEKKLSESMIKVQQGFGGKVSQKHLQEVARESQEQDVAVSIQKQFASDTWKQYASVAVTEDRIQITLREPVLFDSGRAVLKDKAKEILHEFARLAKGLPNEIVIEGHTDDIPPGPRARYSSNFELSMARAYSVIRHLVDTEEIPPNLLAGVGFGEHRPVVPNNSPENRAVNRRIEIGLIRGAQRQQGNQSVTPAHPSQPQQTIN